MVTTTNRDVVSILVLRMVCLRVAWAVAQRPRWYHKKTHHGVVDDRHRDSPMHARVHMVEALRKKRAVVKKGN